MLEGDEVYFVVDTQHVERALSAFGREDQVARRIVVFGGGNIGLFLAQQIEAESPNVSVKVIEQDKERAEFVAKTLNHSVVLNGDVLDPDVLTEAGVAVAETVVCVTNDDETNILAGLLAKRSGARRAITLINKATYKALVGPLGIDVVINPRTITVSNILQHVRRGRIHAVHSLHEGFGELIEADALETSSLVGKPLREVKLPVGVLLGAVVRDGAVISPRGNTVVRAGDRVILFASSDAVKKVEKMFSVRLEYF
jgi:trk system potassium uptake protein TrkA